MEYNDKQIQIILATEKLFAANGFEGTSVRDIAHEAGVNVAMISYYFGSKEKLLEAVFVHRISYSRLTLESLVSNKELEPLEKIDRLVESYVDRMMENTSFHRISMREQLSTSLDGGVIKMINETKLGNMELVKKIVQEGQRKKVFTRQVDVPLLITTMIGTFYQLLATQGFYRMVNGLEGMADEEFHQHLIKKLKAHLKHIIKAALTYENK